MKSMKIGTEESQGRSQKNPKTTTTKAQTHTKTCISLLGLPNRVPQTVWLYTTESYVSLFWKIEI